MNFYMQVVDSCIYVTGVAWQRGLPWWLTALMTEAEESSDVATEEVLTTAELARERADAVDHGGARRGGNLSQERGMSSVRGMGRGVLLL